MNKYFFFVFLLAWLACDVPNQGNAVKDIPVPENQVKLQTIAFGSCNKHHKDQTIWASILQNKPDLWIWLGDMIYADTRDMTKMAKMYDLQKSHPEYQALLNTVPVIGIWDDHDYGVNDGDRNYPFREESREQMMRFLDIPEDSEMRKRKLGAYSAHTFGEEGEKVKIILLDARTFRDPLQKNFASGQRYQTNEEGDILGEEQWQWLESELANSDAQLHIIGCGIQIIPAEHAFEKWANFPAARQRFFEVLKRTKAKRPLLISGDRHIAELSKYYPDGHASPVYELTSSGLTHSYEQAKNEANRYRIGKLVNQRNFGLIYIDWSAQEPVVRVEVRGLENKLYLAEGIEF